VSFSSTHWSVVRAAAGDDSEAAREAFGALFETYSYPLYAYVRRQGYDAEDARDLTQSFFGSILARHDLRRLGPDRGRFRSFLLASVRHFLLNDRARERRLKRGGDRTIVSLECDYDAAERRYVRDPVGPATPEMLFERQWALATLDAAMSRVRAHWRDAGKLREFDRLKPFLAGEKPEGGYAAIARELGATDKAIGVAVHRLRKRFVRALRAEIAATVDTPADVDDELTHLRRVLQR
jgi:RNA polymerase sigma factor (sigma-70 family)